MQNTAITLRSLGSAQDDDAGGRAISHPLSSLLVEGCPCGADLSSAFGAPLLQGAALLACKNTICERNQYSLKYKNTASLTFPFPPRCGSQPPPLRGTSFQRKEGTYTLSPAQKPSPYGESGDRRVPFLPPLSSFRANARNLFRSRSSKSRRTAGSGKHRVPYDLQSRCFPQTDSCRKQKTANEKDPSAPLGMTIRECAFLTFLFIPLRKPTSAPLGHLLPTEGGRMPTSAPSDRLLPAEGRTDARVPLSSKRVQKNAAHAGCAL